MINIPKTLCKCDTINTDIEIQIVPPIEQCEEDRCDISTSVQLIPIVSTLCPCPVEEVVINLKPQPKRTKIIKSCFTQFIKNITSTKFCDTGPTCKAN